ncbi:MAG: SDR family NAD(P)-dependent oxidoreductase, partial [Pseudonocardia sp.]|nr:SDR family NAD(P)-dependent oxidoreductase [Pseudonocardia sp.]
SGPAELAAHLHLLAGDAGLPRPDADGGAVAGHTVGGPGPVWMFSGQGGQWIGMAARLLDTAPVFAAALAEADAALVPHVEISATAALRDGSGTWTARTDVVQPVLWATMVALAATWRAAGVHPAAVVGHSQGEVAAACVAGVLSLADGARVVATRARLAATLDGTMGVVSADAGRTAELCAATSAELCVAARNSPTETVISGPVDAVQALVGAAEAAGVPARRIAVDYAAHSGLVDALREPLCAELAAITPAATTVPWYSTVRGAWMDGTAADAQYWFANLREPVGFAEAIGALAVAGHRHFCEVSPHPVLTTPAGDVLAAALAGTGPAGEVAVHGTLRRGADDRAALVAALASAWAAGAPVEWSVLIPAPGDRSAYTRIATELPTYGFDHRRFWLDVTPAAVQDIGSDLHERFWKAVEDGDLDRLATDLAPLSGAQVGALEAVAPPLAAYHRRTRAHHAVGAWHHHVAFEPVPVPVASASGAWLVVGDDEVATAAAVAALGVRGGQAAVVPAGFPSAAVAAALDSLGGGRPTGVLYVPSTGDATVEGRPGLPLQPAQLLTLLPALESAGVDAPVWAVTRAAASDPRHAAVAGMGRTLALEFPGRWGGLVDLPAVPDPAEWERAPDVLVGAGAAHHHPVRGDAVTARRLRSGPVLPSPTDRDDRTRATRWAPAGTVLVTGGTGGVGARVARAVAARAGTEPLHLLLVGRRGPAAPGVDELCAELVALGGPGTTVAAVAADVSSADGVAAALAAVPAEAPLTAVVHAAGISQSTPVPDTTLEHAEDVAAAKLRGAEHLDAQLGDRPLDAFVLVSSSAGTWGSGGQAVYAAANAGLDGLA